MAKVTIDTLPKSSVQYLNHIPGTIEKSEFQIPKGITSHRVERSIVESKLEKLVGQFFSHQSFAIFSIPEEMFCPNTFTQAMIPSIDYELILENLMDLKMDSMQEQEELEVLIASFSKIHDLEKLYQKILADLKKFQKG